MAFSKRVSCSRSGTMRTSCRSHTHPPGSPRTGAFNEVHVSSDGVSTMWRRMTLRVGSCKTSQSVSKFTKRGRRSLRS